MGARDKLLKFNEANVQASQQATAQSNLIDDIVSEVVTEPTVEPTTEHKPEPIIEHKAEHNDGTEVVSNEPKAPQFLMQKKKTKEHCMSVRLFPEVYDRIQETAKENGLSVNETINQIILQFFNMKYPR